MLKLWSNDEEFLIIGYSFGSLLALDLAGKLESRGLSGSLLLVDGSPKFCHTTSNFALPDKNEEKMKAVAFASCIRLLSPDDHQNVTKTVLSYSTFEEQIKCFAEFAMTKTSYSYEYGAKMLAAVAKRVKIILECDKHIFAPLSSSPISLIRCKDFFYEAIGDDYGLSKYTNKKVKVNVIDGNHSTMLGNSELVKLINRAI